MHKAVQLTVLLALLFCVVHSQSQAMNQTNQTMNQSNQTMNQSMNQSIDLIPGLPVWSPHAPHNDPSCWIMIMAQLMPNGTGVWLNQTYNSSVNVSNSSQSNPHCSFYNFKFKSFFFNEFLNVSLDSWYWTMNSSSMANSTAGFANNSSNMTAMNISNSTMNASNNSSWNASAVMNASDLIMLNGTACLLLPQNEWFGVEQYLCKMVYDSIHVYLLVWGNWVNGTWKWNINNGTQAWWAWSMNTNRQAMNGTNWLSNDQNWGVVVGSLWDSCGSDTNVSSLSSNVTIYTEVNLAYWVPQVWLAYTVIKQWTPNTMHNWNSMNATGWNASYLVWAANMSNNSYNMPFNNSNSSIDGCWSLNMTYGDILPNMSYCEHGCEVTFIFADEMGRIYPIQTTGLWTPNMTMNGTSANGTNTSIATDGNGRRLDVTVGADSSGAGVTVSSGLALGMNIMLLVLSLIYVN